MKLRKRPLAASALFAVIAAIAAGCGAKGNAIVGKWSGIASGPGGMKADVVEDFKADGTMTTTMNLMGHTMTIPGTYTADNGTLTLNNTSRRSPSKIMSQTIQYKLDGDTLTLNSAHEPAPIVLKRQP